VLRRDPFHSPSKTLLEDFRRQRLIIDSRERRLNRDDVDCGFIDGDVTLDCLTLWCCCGSMSPIMMKSIDRCTDWEEGTPPVGNDDSRRAGLMIIVHMPDCHR
jgi:hypothetical protein